MISFLINTIRKEIKNKEREKIACIFVKIMKERCWNHDGVGKCDKLPLQLLFFPGLMR
jgi:hypothetical protein